MCIRDRLYFTIPSDIAKVTGNSTDGLRLIPSNAYTSSQTEIATTWANLYNAIYSANDFIEALQQKIGTYDETNYKKAAVYMAEARCLRALYYFEVVRWFGHVALITNTEQSRQHPSTFTQADPADVYKFIEADLQYAIAVSYTHLTLPTILLCVDLGGRRTNKKKQKTDK